MIDIKHVSLIDMLPPNLLRDSNIRAAAMALDEELSAVTEDIDKCLIVPNIDKQSEAVVDHLAWERHVDFYEPDLPVEKKRLLVQQAPSWHKRKGTPSAVEELVTAVYARTRLEEWWEYGEQPFMFRIVLTNAYGRVRILDLIKVVNIAKNKRSRLDHITFEYESVLNIKTQNLAWRFNYPLCDTYVCGLHPDIAVIGKMLRRPLAINSKVTGAAFDLALTGTAPIISTIGRIINIPVTFKAFTRATLFDYSACGTHKAGLEPIIAVLGQIIRNSIEITSEPSILGFDYKTCGMNPVVSTIGYIIRAPVRTTAKLRHWFFDHNPTDSLSCGITPEIAIIGHSTKNSMQVALDVAATKFNHQTCGTDPITATYGIILRPQVVTYTSCKGRKLKYERCGKEPFLGTKGHIVKNSIGATNELKTARFSYPKCGVEPVNAVEGKSIDNRLTLAGDFRQSRFPYPTCGDLICGTYPAA